MEHIRSFLKISAGFERLLFFVILFMISMHLAACLWIITASIFETDEPVTNDGKRESHESADTVHTWMANI